jgi:hypothetical protein
MVIPMGVTCNVVGQLHVWDLNKPDEPLLASSPLTDEAHLESITKVVWGKSTSRKQHRVCPLLVIIVTSSLSLLEPRGKYYYGT